MAHVFWSKIPLVTERGLKGLAKRLAVLLVLLCAFGVGGIAAHFAVLSRELPDIAAMADYRPPTTSKVFDANGNLVARFYEERRTVVPLERIPAHARNAFISAEDEDFYRHEGIDYLAILRCTLLQVKAKVIGGSVCGGSTITQQTAQTFLLSMEHNYSNKVKKLLLAKRIEEQFSKDQILHLYLNQIYFGNGAYGIEEAARTYYGVGVEKLSLAQSAALASIPKSPNRINPLADPKRVRARRGYVLEQMLKNGLINADDKKRADAEPVRIDVDAPEFLDVAPYYAEAIRAELAQRKDLGADEVARGGLTVYAALDARMQKAANAAVQRGLRELDKRQGYRGPVVRLDPDEAKELGAVFDEERARRFAPEEYPELAKPELLDRPIWDLSKVTAEALRKTLTSVAAVDDEDEEQDPDASAPDAATAAPKHPPIRNVRMAKAKVGAIVGALVKKVDNPAKEVLVDLGTTDAVLPLAAMTWARPFDPEKSTERPRAIGDVLKKGDLVLVQIEKLVAAGKKGPARLEVALEQEPLVEGALVAIDPSSRRVLALVGGYDFTRSSFNRATQAARQPGSSFKPFIYAQGIESKLFNAVGFLDQGADGAYTQRLITDAPKTFIDRWTGQKWEPKNANGRFLGDITLRECLTHSVNTCSVSIVERVGVDPIIDVAKRLNLPADGKEWVKGYALALGTGEVKPIDLVNAYTIFPDGGRHAPYVLIEKVKRADGTVLELTRPAPTQIISPATSSVMSELMKSVVESGTATRARDLGRPVAGKTGTTNDATSVWFVGFTPDLVAGVYVGFDKPVKVNGEERRSIGRNESGGKASVPIWLSFMKEAVKELPARDFELAEGVVKKSIDRATGLLARAEEGLDAGALPEPTFTDEGDPIPKELPKGVIAEVFLAGTEPTQTADDAPPPPLDLVEKGGLGP